MTVCSGNGIRENKQFILIDFLEILVIMNFMEKNNTLSPGKRLTNSLNLRKKIYDLVTDYLANEQYASITIRNICAQTEITASSFYNLYQTFDKFLCEYTIDQFYTFTLAHKNTNSLRGLKKIQYNYELVAQFAQQKGITYVQFLQQQCCKTLSIVNYRKIESETMSKIKIEDDIAYHEAICLNEISPNYKYEVLFTYMDLLVSSSLFNWCNSNGEIQLEDLINLLITDFLHFELNNERYKYICSIIGF